jgi:hypothetical protein
MSSLTNLYKQSKQALEGGSNLKKNYNQYNNNTSYSNPFRSLNSDTIDFSHRDVETSTLSDITINPLVGGIKDDISKLPSRDRYTKFEFAFKKTVNKGLPKDFKEGGAYQYSSVSENDLNALRNIILSDNHQEGGSCGCEGEQSNIKRLNDSATSTMMTAQMGGDYSVTSYTEASNNSATSTMMTAQKGGVYSETSDSNFNLNSESATISNISNSNDTSVLSVQYSRIDQLGGEFSATSPLNDTITTVEALTNKDINTLKNIGSNLMGGKINSNFSSSFSDFTVSVTDNSNIDLTSEDGVNYTSLIGGVRRKQNSKKGKNAKKTNTQRHSSQMSRNSKEDESIDDSSSTTVSESVSPNNSPSNSSSTNSTSFELLRQQSRSQNHVYDSSNSRLSRSIEPTESSESTASNTANSETNNDSSSTTQSANFSSQSQTQSPTQSSTQSPTQSSTQSSTQSQTQSSTQTNSLSRAGTQSMSSKSMSSKSMSSKSRSGLMSDSESSQTSTTHSTSSSRSDSSSYSSKSGNSESSTNETRVGSFRTLQRNYPTSSVNSNSDNVVDVKQFYSSEHDSLYSSSETNFLRNNLNKNRFR